VNPLSLVVKSRDDTAQSGCYVVDVGVDHRGSILFRDEAPLDRFVG
jgi:hypothetical protein